MFLFIVRSVYIIYCISIKWEESTCLFIIAKFLINKSSNSCIITMWTIYNISFKSIGLFREPSILRNKYCIFRNCYIQVLYRVRQCRSTLKFYWSISNINNRCISSIRVPILNSSTRSLWKRYITSCLLGNKGIKCPVSISTNIYQHNWNT